MSPFCTSLQLTFSLVISMLLFVYSTDDLLFSSSPRTVSVHILCNFALVSPSLPKGPAEIQPNGQAILQFWVYSKVERTDCWGYRWCSRPLRYRNLHWGIIFLWCYVTQWLQVLISQSYPLKLYCQFYQRFFAQYFENLLCDLCRGTATCLTICARGSLSR